MAGLVNVMAVAGVAASIAIAAATVLVVRRVDPSTTLARVVGWAYTLFLIAVTVWLALRRTPRSHAPLVWSSILVLATMRSPFLPTYAWFPSLWLATLLAAVWWNRLRAGGRRTARHD